MNQVQLRKSGYSTQCPKGVSQSLTVPVLAGQSRQAVEQASNQFALKSQAHRVVIIRLEPAFFAITELFPNKRIIHHSSSHVSTKAVTSRLKQSPVTRCSFFDDICPFNRGLLHQKPARNDILGRLLKIDDYSGTGLIKNLSGFKNKHGI